jgi:hypothetical protein
MQVDTMGNHVLGSAPVYVLQQIDGSSEMIAFPCVVRRLGNRNTGSCRARGYDRAEQARHHEPSSYSVDLAHFSISELASCEAGS